MKTLSVNLELVDNEIWAHVEAPGLVYATVGRTVEEINIHLKELVVDFLEHEGKHNPYWAGVGINDIVFDYTGPFTQL